MSEVTAWMVYAVVVATVLGVAAVAGESAVRDSGKPGRWVWGAAMLLSATLPVLALAGLSLASVPVVPESILIPLGPLVAGGSVGGGPGSGVAGAFVVGWVVVTVLLVAWLALSWLTIWRSRGGWRPAVVEGVPVFVTPEMGPAVWGIRRPRILLPEWALALEARVRRLMLMHEGEHVSAGDARLVLAGLSIAVVLPWNLPLWWQFRRLRQAVELDCDVRVLRRAPDARRYGSLLLEVGLRRSARVPVLALAEPASFLERRIRAILATAKTRNVSRVVGLASLAGALTVLAVCARDPLARDSVAVTDESAPALQDRIDHNKQALRDRIDQFGEAASGREPGFTPFTKLPRLRNATEVSGALERAYPRLLRDAGIGGRVVAWLFVDATGRVVKTQVANGSGHPALDAAALSVAGRMEFSPAYDGEEAVAVWVKIPVTFTVRADGMLGGPQRVPRAPSSGSGTLRPVSGAGLD